jgi:acyl-CoA synthetase (AMP-forming)/AMP-acid ligase II
MFPFAPKTFYDRLGDKSLPPINTFTAVPTIYTRLVSYYQQLPEADRPAATAAIQHLKLAMCGSAALPQSLRDDWERLSGGKVPLLERYGMTETAITLSQPLDATKRVAGSVGSPVPSVVARLVDPDNGEVVYQSNQKGPIDTKRTGEIELCGPVVFKSYWNKPDASKETFSEDGWMKTGDIARVDELGNIFILGRASMDIIKSGGEKLSALEIEREILSLPQIAEVSVVGVDSEQWGQEVSAVVVLSKQGRAEDFDLAKMKAELKKTMAGWKIPKRMIVLDEIPRNQMGKVNKKTLVKIFE